MFIEIFSKDWAINGDGEETEASFDARWWPFNLELNEAANFQLSAYIVVGSNQDALIGTFTVGVSANQIILPSHGLTNGTQVRFAIGVEPSNVLPAPLVAGTYYYVVGARGNDFQVSTTSGGAVIDITNAGVGGTNEVWKHAVAGETLTPIECECTGSFMTLRFPQPIPGGERKTIRLRAKVFV